MTEQENVWVGIEVTRQVRMAGGRMASPGELSAGGANLLDHQLGIARQVTSPDRICVLTPQGDESVLELIAKHEVREIAPFDFIAMLSERAKQGEKGAVVLLRQIAPLRDASDVHQALKLARKHPLVVSASKPPDGHPRHTPPPDEDAPDYRCLAFEIRRISEFSREAVGTGPADEKLEFIEWESFAELIRPEDEPEVAAKMKAWV
jgi:hypothetical protein